MNCSQISVLLHGDKEENLPYLVKLSCVSAVAVSSFASAQICCLIEELLCCFNIHLLLLPCQSASGEWLWISSSAGTGFTRGNYSLAAKASLLRAAV